MLVTVFVEGHPVSKGSAQGRRVHVLGPPRATFPL